MGTLVLPDHKLIRHPPVLRRDGAPKLIHGCLVVSEGGHVMLIPYVHGGGQAPAAEIAAFAMTEADFARSMLVAAIDYLPGILLSERQLN